MKYIKILLLASLVFATGLLQAQVAPVDDNGLAIGGYDVVAYFSGEAKQGSEAFTSKYKGATYQFSSKANLETFEKSPKQYLPQFDGYCAWGVAEKGAKFPINPETFDIVDGKLYLFFNGDFQGEPYNTMLPWNAETTKLKDAAHEKWAKVKKI
ncbi:MAG: YHS domain-containing protein [Bacteroidia bacterium]|nr:YHS domain-containing protein [Bacteroidia bacterium]